MSSDAVEAVLLLEGKVVGEAVGTITTVVETFTFGPFDERVTFDAVEVRGRDGERVEPAGGGPFTLPRGMPFTCELTTAYEPDPATARGAVEATGTVSGHGRIVDPED